MSLFGIVVAVAVQNVFRLEMYQNEVFLFFKKIFLTSAYQNDLKTLKKIHFKKSKFLKTRFTPRSQTHSTRTPLNLYAPLYMCHVPDKLEFLITF